MLSLAAKNPHQNEKYIRPTLFLNSNSTLETAFLTKKNHKYFYWIYNHSFTKTTDTASLGTLLYTGSFKPV